MNEILKIQTDGTYECYICEKCNTPCMALSDATPDSCLMLESGRKPDWKLAPVASEKLRLLCAD